MKKITHFTWVVGLIMAGCVLEDPTLPIDTDEVISLTVVDDDLVEDNTLLNVPADSLSTRLILITLNKKTDADQVVTLQTTRGVLTKAGEKATLSSGSNLVLTAGDRVLLAQLHVLDRIDSVVTVAGTVGNVTNVLQFNFAPSFPTDIDIQQSSINPVATEDVTFTISLRTMYGKVSEGLNVLVKDVTLNGVTLNHPAFIPVKRESATLIVKNIGAKTGVVTLEINIPTGVDKSENAFKYKYQSSIMTITYK